MILKNNFSRASKIQTRCWARSRVVGVVRDTPPLGQARLIQRRAGGIGLSFVEGSFEPADVDQKIYWCGFACVGMCVDCLRLASNLRNFNPEYFGAAVSVSDFRLNRWFLAY